MMTERFSVEFLLGLFCCGCFLLHGADCVLVDPLQELDVLKSYRVANQRQCRRLCWYLKPCARFSFYDKNDNSRTEGDNCVLHLDEEWDHNLPEGWVEGIASGDGLVRMELKLIYLFQTQKGSNERLFILTRTHSIPNRMTASVLKQDPNRKRFKRTLIYFEPFCVWILF